MLRDNAADSSIRNHSVLTAVFTGPPSDLGFRENLGSAAPVELLLGAVYKYISFEHRFPSL
jgi:hypothetical protein